jgi:hypothetical protein
MKNRKRAVAYTGFDEKGFGQKIVGCVYEPQKPVRKRTERKPRPVKNHRLTIGYLYTNEKTVPMIRLAGDWLNRQGFSLGKKVVVQEQRGRLVIQLEEEATA